MEVDPRGHFYHPHSLHPYPANEEREALAGMPIFDSARILAAQYSARLFNEGFSVTVCDIASQGQTRVAQLSYLMRCVAVVRRELRLAWQDPIPKDVRYYSFLLNLYGESFYYFAHHLQEIIVNGHLPFLDDFGAVANIALVRNKLIEHAERENITDIRGTLGGDFLLRLKDSRREGQPKHPRDDGLIQNATALQQALEKVYEAAFTRWV
jgi:hypothetical protein